MQAERLFFGLLWGGIAGIIIYFCLYIVLTFLGAIGMGNLEKGAEWAHPFALHFGLASPVIGLIIGVAMNAREQEQERKDQEYRQKRDRADAQDRKDKAAAELERQKKQLGTLETSSRQGFLTLFELVPSADAHLDCAEEEFTEGAFAPFWDEIEHATNKLAAYHSTVLSICMNAKQYKEQAARLTIPIAPLSLDRRFPDARPVAQRLAQLVRAAQKNFHFATIYEQRKTNKLLYEGFGTLASAISSLNDKISSSLGELSKSMDDILETAREQKEIIQSVADRDSLAMLMARVKAYCSNQSESKADLAKYLRVCSSDVDEWLLAGEEPSNYQIILIRDWLGEKARKVR
ncbi:MAG: hypothetical protein ACOYMN_18915 [Roseimicrobium sp.]